MDYDQDESDSRAVALSLDAARQKADLDQQISTAKSYPRSYKKFGDKCMSLATASEEVAAGMLYALTRGGKAIEGPSARMAEVIQHAWGNNQSGQRVIDEGEEFVTAEGIFYDLETNVRITVQVKRRILDKNGQRFNIDMIGVTGNAAASIAHRNAVLKGVPKSFWNPIYLAARKAAVGDIKTLASKRTEAVAWVCKHGITEAQVLAALGCVGMEDIDLDKLATLKAVVESVKSKEVTIDEAFPPVDTKRPESTKGKPTTKEPERKKGAAKKEAKGATPKRPAKIFTDDQMTVVKDKLNEEGVKLQQLLDAFNVPGLDYIDAKDYGVALDMISKISEGK
jgi:hypothetical protein